MERQQSRGLKTVRQPTAGGGQVPGRRSDTTCGVRLVDNARAAPIHPKMASKAPKP